MHRCAPSAEGEKIVSLYTVEYFCVFFASLHEVNAHKRDVCLYVCPHVMSPSTLNRFLRNLYLKSYTENCQV
jgi:hypothetical protein